MAAFHRATAITSSPAQGTLPSPPNETWFIATALGVRALTLDELEPLLASGEVGMSTPVWIPGMAEWEPLASVANLEDGPPLDQGPGTPPFAVERVPGVAAAPATRPPQPSAGVGGPLGLALGADDPSDPNHALWVSIAPRPAVPAHSGVWRRVEVSSAQPETRPGRPRLVLCAVICASVLLMLLGAWRAFAAAPAYEGGHVAASERAAI